MRIGIIGTRGIPNNYGGFEQHTEILSTFLVKNKCEVFVYNSHNHPYKLNNYKNVNIIHKFDPEFIIGTFGQFIYDLNCILDSRSRKFDIILLLGYTSSSIWNFLLPKKSKIITNIDGIEYERDKYNFLAKFFLKFAEKLAINKNHHIIADSQVIKTYIDNKFNINSTYIAYGVELFHNPDENVLYQLNIKPKEYFLLIARIQPDNNIETIIRGVTDSNSEFPLLIIGNFSNKYGKYLKMKYNNHKIRFIGSLFDKNILNNLRYYSLIYFHGHSAGGTNPSLLEAMAASAFICANNNSYNIEVLENNALYFSNEIHITNIINEFNMKIEYQQNIQNNLKNIVNKYSIEFICNQYYKLFQSISNLNKTKKVF